MAGVRIAITGTPGVGKTSFCAAMNHQTKSVEEIALFHECLGDTEEDGAAPID